MARIEEQLIQAGNELAYLLSDMSWGSITDPGPYKEDVSNALSEWESARSKALQQVNDA
jgi:hypothetical protein